LNLLQSEIHNFNSPRYNVRRAELSEIENLKRVAREMRNDYDRFHADPVFKQAIADEFLATYIQEAVKVSAILFWYLLTQGFHQIHL
jgi:dTDP-4-amino-4,6-dideoxy-D-galactose acyltransferase